MTLINCPECSRHVSTLAKSCPNCGCPQSDFPPADPAKVVSKPLKSEQVDKALGEVRPVDNQELPTIPGDWKMTTDTEVIAEVEASRVEGGLRDSVWYVSENHKRIREIQNGESSATRAQVKGIIAGKVPGLWFRSRYHLSPDEAPRGWLVESGLFLRYEHRALKKVLVVPVQGKGDWLAAFFPGLWHLIRWTPRGMGVGIGFLIAQIFLAVQMEGMVGRRDNWWTDWDQDTKAMLLFRLTLHLIAAFTYFHCASRWRIEYLEKRGFKCTDGVQAQTRDEAIAKFPTH